MDEEIDRLLISVRADTQGFARDVEAMRDALTGPLGEGAVRAGQILESNLMRAIKTGRIGFDDLKRVALSTLAEIASAAVRSGIGALLGGGSGSGGSSGLVNLGATIATTLLGLPGRATGGPVSPGRGYLVGERGPEMFVPTTSGSIAPMAGSASRDVRVSITVNAPPTAAPDMLARSSRQVARAVRGALMQER